MSSTEPAGVRFRDYEARDFPRLCELDRMCFPPRVAYSPQEIAAALLQPDTFGVVAESTAATAGVSPEVVGFVLVSRSRGVLGHIITIDIHPDFRGRGLGTRLMVLGEQQLAGRGVQRVVLEVNVDNEIAISFYKRRGYATRRTLPNYYRDRTDAYLMEKAL